MSKKNNLSEERLSKREELTAEKLIKLRDKIDSIPMSELPRIYNGLNRYEWAEELGEKPDSFKENSTGCTEQLLIMEYIECKCGAKALSRYRHVVEQGYTDQQFEDWWDSRLYKTQNEIYNRYCECNSSNNERENCGFSVEYALTFIVGLLLASFFFCFIHHITIGC